MATKNQLEKKNSGYEPKGTWWQDELIGGKSSIIK
jgi:hypothetical protein